MRRTFLLWLCLAFPFVALAGKDPPAGSRGRCPGRLLHAAGRAFAAAGDHLLRTDATTYCLGCHDGTVSCLVTTSVATSAAGERVVALPSANHPVDVPYPVARKSFRPRADVERTLPLTNGRVTCETCHSGDPSSPAQLTVPNTRSRLCLTCHDR